MWSAHTLCFPTPPAAQVQEFGWPDGHAPPLDRICSICKAMENWLHAHPQHVAVLHCKVGTGLGGLLGGLGRGDWQRWGQPLEGFGGQQGLGSLRLGSHACAPGPCCVRPP